MSIAWMKSSGVKAVRIAFALALSVGHARGESLSQRPSTDPERRPFATREQAARSPKATSEGSAGWWVGTAGIALAIAVCGGVSLASRRYSPKGATGSLRVVGRTSLSPKHTVYLLQAGDRVLIVGTGPQGAPSLLGELTGAADATATVEPQVTAKPSQTTNFAGGSHGRLDLRIGDDV